VVVTLAEPPLARAVSDSRVLTARAKAKRLDLASPFARSYLASLARAQRTLAASIVRTVPGTQVRWRYQVVLAGLAVVVPRARLAALARVPGVAKVWPSYTYHALLDRSPEVIGADQLWGPSFATAGNGIKIGIIDDGVDQSHPFFNPAGFTAPPGFPKGDVAYTTAKVIVARAFAPASTTWRYARTPFDPELSEHATHVAGIAAGDNPTVAAGGRNVSGVAPRAFLGNYKVLTVPTDQFGLNGNSPEIAAGIEAAVRDGMDVINLSLGEPEIEPSRDLVVNAIRGATAAGVVATIAAGNEYEDYGRGSVSSPGSAPDAITVGAVSKSDVIASFSSSGPTPISLQLKPDVSAPGVDIVSSVPSHNGSWASFSGTSMAAPHVAGAAALLRQRHPEWTPAQVKSALATTAGPVRAAAVGDSEVLTTREGAGLVNLPRALEPRFFAAPVGLSFGLLAPGSTATRRVTLTDAGDGAGDWTPTVSLQGAAAGASISAPPTVTVPGALDVTATAAADAADHDVTGFLVLTRGTDVRRIPFWFRVAAPKLASEPHRTLSRTGTYTGTLAGKPSAVTSYRYPDDPSSLGLRVSYPGPEQVFRVQVRRPVENFGVAVLSSSGTAVSPHVVVAGDENRQLGIPSLPLAINPYLSTFQQAEPVSGAIRPAPGEYDIVFDSAAAGGGAFTFRFWLDDTTPPAVKLLTGAVPRRGRLALSVDDAGSGVDPRTLVATVDGKDRVARYESRTGRVTVAVGAVAAGRHRLMLQVSDYQEAKNMENVPQILPNTRVYRAGFTVRATP
jgi:subtilisin family serine protease